MNVGIYKRLRSIAKNGRTSSHSLRLWRSQISKLEKEGFRVIEDRPTGRLNEWVCVVTWQNTKVKECLAYRMLKIASNARMLKKSD